MNHRPKNKTASIRMLLLWTLTAAPLMSGSSCSKSSETESTVLPPCTSEHLFQILPMDASVLAYVAPIGILAPIGGSPLPKAHTGFMLTAPAIGTPILAPGNLTITEYRRVKYVVSPTRQGYEDYSLNFKVCNEVTGHLGHVTHVASFLIPTSGQNCTTYSTVDETVESCTASLSVPVTQGTQIATSGTHPSAPAVDIGMEDTRITGEYVNPSRYGKVGQPGALCPWDWFADGPKALLYARIGLTASQLTTETPKCGSLAIDQNGTAAGRWTLKSAPADGTSATAGAFAVFTPDPYFPQSKVALSTRIPALSVTGATTYFKFPTTGSGSVNRLPSAITADGAVYCYVEDASTSTASFFVQLLTAAELRVEKVTHTAGNSPCSLAPGSRTFSASAVDLIR